MQVAVIDSGVYYLHPALGGCFGQGCKVEFGYGKRQSKLCVVNREFMMFLDLVGDAYSSSDSVPMPDSDPLDDCSESSHGIYPLVDAFSHSFCASVCMYYT